MILQKLRNSILSGREGQLPISSMHGEHPLGVHRGDVLHIEETNANSFLNASPAHQYLFLSHNPFFHSYEVSHICALHVQDDEDYSIELGSNMEWNIYLTPVAIEKEIPGNSLPHWNESFLHVVADEKGDVEECLLFTCFKTIRPEKWSEWFDDDEGKFGAKEFFCRSRLYLPTTMG